jgi:hypothetical protein
MSKKTPMQELIDTFEEMRSPIDSKVDVDFAISLVKSMLEKEKEILIETSINSYTAGYLDNQAKVDDSMNFPEEYYNETFNTK